MNTVVANDIDTWAELKDVYAGFTFATKGAFADSDSGELLACMDVPQASLSGVDALEL